MSNISLGSQGVKCVCFCHSTGKKFLTLKFPPTDCCKCPGLEEYKNIGLDEIVNLNLPLPPKFGVGERKDVSPLIEEIQKLSSRIEKYENDNIIRWGRLLDEVKSIKSECDTHCEAILTLEKKLPKIEEHVLKIYELVNIEDRVTASDILCRLTALENICEESVSVNESIASICSHCKGHGIIDLNDNTGAYVNCDWCHSSGRIWS